MDPGHHVDDRAVRSGCAGVERGMVQSYIIQIVGAAVFLFRMRVRQERVDLCSDLRLET